MSSESQEMYLKTVYELQDAGDEPVAVSGVSERLGVAVASALEMIKRLAEQDLLIHTPYRGVALTDEGRRQAARIVRRQRLWGRFLADYLDMPWSRVYDEACKLEHATDDEVTEALAAFLNHPATCPHGNPVPAADGSVSVTPAVPLSDLAVGQSGTVARVFCPESVLLDHLAGLGLLPGTAITVQSEAPYDGPLTISVDGKPITLGQNVAARVFVSVTG